MSRTIIAVDSSESVRQVTKLMLKNKVGSVLVRDEKDYVGIITERDLLKLIDFERLNPDMMRAGAIMSSPLVTVDASASLFEASDLMLEKGIRRLGVIEKGRVIGVVTQRDINRGIQELFLLFNQALHGVAR